MEKIVLVTGGCGFIGTNFIKETLKKRENYFIINLDKLTYAGNLENLKDEEGNPRYTFVKGDICDEGLVDFLVSRGGELFGFKGKGVDYIVNFAAESHVDRSILGPKEFLITNVFGTFNLLEASRRWNIEKFLHVSTDEVYGSLGDEGSFREDTPYAPSSPYSASKASSDHFVYAYFKTYGLPTVITNCSNNFGPYQFPEKLIPLVILRAFEGKPIPIYGDGKNVRDWIYVLDHVEGILTVLEKGRPGEKYNIGARCEWQNIELVKLILSLLEKKLGKREGELMKLITFVEDRPGHDRRYAIDPSKIERELGWKAKTPFKKAIEDTVDWYIKNKDWMYRVISGEYRDYFEKQYGRRLKNG